MFHEKGTSYGGEPSCDHMAKYGIADVPIETTCYLDSLCHYEQLCAGFFSSMPAQKLDLCPPLRTNELMISTITL